MRHYEKYWWKNSRPWSHTCSCHLAHEMSTVNQCQVLHHTMHKLFQSNFGYNLGRILGSACFFEYGYGWARWDYNCNCKLKKKNRPWSPACGWRAGCRSSWRRGRASCPCRRTTRPIPGPAPGRACRGRGLPGTIPTAPRSAQRAEATSSESVASVATHDLVDGTAKQRRAGDKMRKSVSAIRRVFFLAEMAAEKFATTLGNPTVDYSDAVPCPLSYSIQPSKYS